MNNQNRTTIFFQLLLMIISSSLLIVLFSRNFYTFQSYEMAPELITEYPKGEFKQITVHTGLYIRDFSTFDTDKGKFTLEGIVWFKFKENEISLDDVGKFVFDSAKIKYVSKPGVRKDKDYTTVHYGIRLAFDSELDNTHFPLTDHTIYIILDNRFVSSKNVKFESDKASFVFANGFHVTGYDVNNYNVKTGYMTSELNKNNPEDTISHPRAVFSIDFSRKDFVSLITLIMPIVIIFYINVFTFAINPSTILNTMLPISTDSVTALLAYKFVMDSNSPKADYFMVSDYLFFLVLAIVFIIYLINSQTQLISKKTKELITIAFHLLVLIVMAYLAYYY